MVECSCPEPWGGPAHPECPVHGDKATQLPEWIQTLVEAEKDKAYQKGYDKGYQWGIEQCRSALENLNSRW